MQEQQVGRRRDDLVPLDVVRMSTDDELDLVSLWFLMRRRWRWLLAGLLVGLLVAIAHLALATPLHESRASISVGKLADLGPLEDPGVLAAELLERYGRGVPYLREAIRPARQGGVLTLVAVAHSPEGARNFLEQVVSDIMQRHEERFQSAIDPLRQRLDAIGHRISDLTAQVAQVGELVERLKVTDSSQAALLAIQRGSLYPELNQLERDQAELQRLTSQPHSEPSKVITDPSLSNRSLVPQYATFSATGAMLGLVLGALAVFLREFFTVAQMKAPTYK